MLKQLTYTYIFYYGLKNLEKEDSEIIDNFIEYFKRDINIDEFINSLIKNNYMTLYAHYVFSELRDYNYESFFKFIKNNDCLNYEDAKDIFIFLMCTYLGFNFKDLQTNLKVFIIVNKIIDNINILAKEKIFIFKTGMFTYLSVTEVLSKLKIDRKAYLLKFINMDIISLNINQIPVYLYDYVLCIEDKAEDFDLISNNNKVAMTTEKKEKVLDLISLIDCFSEDDLVKDALENLKKELFS